MSPPSHGGSNTQLYAVLAGRDTTVAVGDAENDQAGRTLAIVAVGDAPRLQRVQSSPRGDDRLFALASGPRGDWAVGTNLYWQGAGAPRTLIAQHPAGAEDWRIGPSPAPVPGGENQLGGVAVIGDTVWIVGEHDGAAALRTLIAHSCR